MSKQPRRRAAIRQNGIERLHRFSAARLSVVAFCGCKGVSCHAFSSWKHKLAAGAAAATNDPPASVARPPPGRTQPRRSCPAPGACPPPRPRLRPRLRPLPRSSLYTEVLTCKHLGMGPLAYLGEALPGIFALGEKPTDDAAVAGVTAGQVAAAQDEASPERASGDRVDAWREEPDRNLIRLLIQADQRADSLIHLCAPRVILDVIRRSDTLCFGKAPWTERSCSVSCRQSGATQMNLKLLAGREDSASGPVEPLRMTVLSREEDLDRLSGEWDELLRRSLTHQPMLSPAWLLPWWEVYGRNTGRQLRVGVVREAERLVGLVPLHCRRYWYRPGIPFRRLEWLGADVDEQDGVCSEYLHLIAEAGRADEVFNCFVNTLCQGAFGGWDELVLGAMDGDHPCTKSLAQALAQAGLPLVVTPQTTAAFIPLPDTWDDYLKALPGRHRRVLLKTQRDFDTWADGKASFHRATSPAEVTETAGLLRTLHGERWGCGGRPGGAFQSPRFDRFHRRVLPELAGRDAVEICWLSVRGEPVAVNYSLVWDRKVYFYQCGRRLDLPAKVRVGVVLHAEAIRAAISAGCREYDFLGGAAQYKQQLALGSRPLVQCRVTRWPWRERARRLFEWGLDCLRPFHRRANGLES